MGFGGFWLFLRDKTKLYSMVAHDNSLAIDLSQVKSILSSIKKKAEIWFLN